MLFLVEKGVTQYQTDKPERGSVKIPSGACKGYRHVPRVHDRTPGTGHTHFADEKRGDPQASSRETVSLLDACDVGSPHAAFWAACSPGASATPVGAVAAIRLIQRIAVDVCPGSDSVNNNSATDAAADCEHC